MVPPVGGGATCWRWHCAIAAHSFTQPLRIARPGHPSARSKTPAGRERHSSAHARLSIRNPWRAQNDVVPGALQEGGRGSPTRWSQPAAKDPAGIENTERCLDRRERGLSCCGKQRWLQPRFESVIPALFWARLVRGAAVHGLRSPGSAFGFGIEIHRLRRSHPSIP